MRILTAMLMAALAPPALAAPAAATYDCRIDRLCVAGEACQATADSFVLTPTAEGYGASIDGDQVRLRRIGIPAAPMQSFAVASPDSVSVMLSLLPGGAVIVTIQEDIDGPHAETMLGQCVEEI